MDFYTVLDQVIALLRSRGRVSYRALKRQFALEDDYLEDLKVELVKVHRLAVDQDGTMLVWTGEANAAAAPMFAPSTSTAVSPPSTTHTQEPLVYTPAYLAEKILTSRSALEDERKQVTVLFADLKGSMELLADRDPEEARQLLDPVLERMMAAVHRYEGTVNQVMGDGIMALFGAPIAHEDHAVRACYAALAMQDAIRRYHEEVRRSHGVTIQIRVGLNAGEVVVRAIGNDLHMDYSAIGETTHLAARMEQLAPPGSIRLTAATLRLVEGLVQVNAVGDVPVKGLLEPVAVFDLVGVAAARPWFREAALQGLSCFVGRHLELQALGAALARVGSGHGQLVAISGEPGIGKSRLLYEFSQELLTEGWRVLEVGAVSYGQAMPYLSIGNLLRAYFQIDDQDNAHTIREKVDKRLTYDVALQEMRPVVLALLDTAADAPEWQALDPSQRRQRIIEGVKRLLLQQSQVQPLLVLIENLHWIDAGTQAVLDSLIESLPTGRLLLLVSYRPEYQHGWESKTYYTQLRLHPLSPEAIEELLNILLGEAAELQPVKQLLLERSAGNPFFLEESVRTLVETQVLSGERGAYRLVTPLVSLQVPVTVQALLAARIDRLPLAEKHLLQTAAVIGREMSFSLLQAVARVPEEALCQSLAHLQQAEFLYETRLYPEHAYTFKHALTHDVAYGSLLQGQRRVLHICIVEAMERLWADRLPAQIEQFAHHAVRGAVWEKALKYCHQAGLKAATRSAHREAVEYFEHALSAIQYLPETPDILAQAIDLRFDLRNALLPLGEHERIGDHLHIAETLAWTLDDQRRLGRVFAYLAEYFRTTGDAVRAVESGERALALATDLEDFALQIMATFFLGTGYYALGEYRRAVDCFRRNVAALPGERLRERFGMTGFPAVMSRTWLVSCLAYLGEFDAGIVGGNAAIELAELTEHPFTLTQAYYALGTLFLHQGDLGQAIPVLERSLDLCQTATILTWFPTVAAALGYAYALSGRLPEALPLLQQAVAQDTSKGITAGHAWWTAHLSEAYLLAGHMDKAVELARSALAFARTLMARGFEAYALRLFGELCAHQEPLAAAAYYQQALTLANELGMRPLVAHCHRGLGTLYARTGQYAQARTALYAAMAQYRAMGMLFWLPKAEAALTQIEER